MSYESTDIRIDLLKKYDGGRIVDEEDLGYLRGNPIYFNSRGCVISKRPFRTANLTDHGRAMLRNSET